jgi:hypothetical protein
MITLDMLLQGFFVLGFHITPDMSADEPHISLPRQGNVGIKARFKSARTEQITFILYTEYPGNIEIYNSRNVTVE